MAITIEDIEKLAENLHTEQDQQRNKLLRLIRAEVRVLAGREPEQFQRKALEERDEAGHWDNSYPPKVCLYNKRGPRLVKLVSPTIEDVPTSGGFYYSWRRETVDPGIYAGRDGLLYGRYDEGTGRLGQFAAHPGDCDVAIEYDWRQLDPEEISLEDLQAAEQELRSLAFPLATDKVA